MSEFAYLVLDRAGRERRGSLRAETPDEAREKLSARGLFVVRMESASGEAAPPLLSRQIFGRKKL
ncbi:MAG TPA: type II secretion system protein GspF, partial [Allosphingosinicella sp.]|nr:type II secretion system protein GspF [Allosphingosinicella sp.]